MDVASLGSPAKTPGRLFDMLNLLIALAALTADPARCDSHIHVVDPLMTTLGGAEIWFKGNDESIGQTDLYGRLDFTAELDAAGNISRLLTKTSETTGVGSELVLRVEKSGYLGRTVKLNWRQNRETLQKGFAVSLWTEDYVSIAHRIVTNPSHYAVALRYDPQLMPSAFVVAKAADAQVQQLLQAAPCVQVVPFPELARALYNEVDIGEYVPPKFNPQIQQAFAQPNVALRPTAPTPQNVPELTPIAPSQPPHDRPHTAYYPVYYPVPVPATPPPPPPPQKCCLLRLFDDLCHAASGPQPQPGYPAPQPMASAGGGNAVVTARPAAPASQATGQFFFPPYQQPQISPASGYASNQRPPLDYPSPAGPQPFRFDVYLQQQLDANRATEWALGGGAAIPPAAVDSPSVR